MIAQNDLQNKQIEMIYSMMGIKMEGFEVRTFKQWKGYLDKYLIDIEPVNCSQVLLIRYFQLSLLYLHLSYYLLCCCQIII